MLPAIGLLLVLALVAAGGGKKKRPSLASSPPAYWVSDDAGKSVPVPADVAGDALELVTQALARCPEKKAEIRAAVIGFLDTVPVDARPALDVLELELDGICR